MSAVGEAYSTGSVPSDSLAINTRIVGTVPVSVSQVLSASITGTSLVRSMNWDSASSH